MARQIKKLYKLPEDLIIRRNHKTVPQVFESSSSLDWYKLTESTRHILNRLITSSAKKQMEERGKSHPDIDRLQALRSLSQTVVEITSNPVNFESKQRMQEILKEYADIDIR